MRRAWTANERGVSEHVAVMHNESLDRVLTETWAEYVEELLPVEISQLFFFDGEKIEGFADRESSTQLLARAVHSLLGLDVVNRLSRLTRNISTASSPSSGAHTDLNLTTEAARRKLNRVTFGESWLSNTSASRSKPKSN